MTTFIIVFLIIAVLTAIDIVLLSKSEYWKIDANNPEGSLSNMIYCSEYLINMN